MIVLINDFKTIQFAAYFTDLDEQRTRLYRFLLSRLLASHTASFDTKKKMNEHLEFLYGAYFTTHIHRMSNLNVIQVTMTFPDPKIIEDASLMRRAATLFHDVIFDHQLFEEDLFNEETRMLKEQWDTLKDRKRLYAEMQFHKHFFKGDAYANPVSGKRSDLRHVDAKGLFAYYKDVFLHNPRTIVMSGRIGSEEERHLRELFSEETKNEHELKLFFRKPRKQTLMIEDRTDMKQAILKIGYHLPIHRDDDLYTAAMILNLIIGGFPESRLFKEIREKEGLCYDIQSSYDPYKGVFMISSGVDLSMRNKALSRIRDEIDRVRKTGITQDELRSAAMYYENRIKSSLDRQSVLTHKAFIKDILGRDESIEERLEYIRKTTSHDVIRAAEKLTIDTVYVLHGGDES